MQKTTNENTTALHRCDFVLSLAFGRTLCSLQNTRFCLSKAEIADSQNICRAEVVAVAVVVVEAPVAAVVEEAAPLARL
jgi:hypothetical protein